MKTENKKLLIVEDNTDSVLLYKAILDNNGLTIADNGEKAIEILGEENFDLIILDLYMPKMNGIECLKEIRNNMKIKTPVLVVTATLVGLMDGVLIKPIYKKDLLSKINELVK